jgi:hypothetical protein
MSARGPTVTIPSGQNWNHRERRQKRRRLTATSNGELERLHAPCDLEIQDPLRVEEVGIVGGPVEFVASPEVRPANLPSWRYLRIGGRSARSWFRESEQRELSVR